MARVEANGIELEYEELGEGEPLLLIMGLGAQLIHWPDGFCEQLAERGYRVIRFDNRDVGLSSKLDEVIPDIRILMAKAMLGLPVRTPYSLVDMADDSAGLLDALGIDRAHVLGASMGGMIAQTMAIRHPERLHSLTSIMSHTGDKRFMLSSPRAIRTLMGPAPHNRAEAMDRAVEFYQAVGSQGFELDVDSLRERAGRAYERCFYPRGFIRQLAAVMTSGSRSDALRYLRVPALVVHGTVDPLIRVAGGHATAAAIPGARLELVEGMGHDLPEGAWPQMLGAIDQHARSAG
jgi:pimeloyl-ACP methyl ester carboxylesterase